MAINHLYTDCGRSSYGYSEQKDCVVRAITVLQKITYPEAHLMTMRYGRMSNKGMEWDHLSHMLCSLNAVGNNLWTQRSYITLSAFVKQNPKGRFLAIIKGHCFPVIDGKVIDMQKNGGNCRIISYWKF